MESVTPATTIRDDQREYLEGTLRLLLVAMPIALGLRLLLHPSWASVGFVGALEASGLLLLALTRAGRWRAAAWLGGGGAVLALLVATPMFGGLAGSVPSTFPVVVLLMALILGPRAGLGAAVVVSLGTLGLFGMEVGLGSAPATYMTQLDRVVTLLALIGVVVMVTNVKLGQMRSSAEAQARLLAERDRELALRRQAQEELRDAMDRVLAASQAKTDFLANMSHELRTPLNAVIGYAEMLLEDADTLTEPDLSRILASGRHLLALIDDLLDLAKIEAGRLRVDPEVVDLHALLSGIVQAIGPAMAVRRNALVVEIPPHPGAMRTDPTRLRQVLLNLLSNAVKFTDQGTVSLRVLPGLEGGREVVRFEVEDTGIGIAEDVLPRLFEPFVQGDSSTRRRYGGSGLGLALSARLARMLEGAIEVESELGRGSRFTLIVPRVAAEATVSLGTSRAAQPRVRAAQ